MRARKLPHPMPWGLFVLCFDNGNEYSFVDQLKVFEFNNTHLPKGSARSLDITRWHGGRYEVLMEDGPLRSDSINDLICAVIEEEGK